MPRANKKISLAESIKEALVLSMKKDKNVLIIGLGVDVVPDVRIEKLKVSLFLIK